MIWRWSLKHTFLLLLSIDLFRAGRVILLLIFAKGVFRRFGSLRAKTRCLPTLATPTFAEFSRLGRAMRLVIPLGDGGCLAESDSDKLALTDQLITSVLCEIKICYSGQPVILVSDHSADPLVIPSLAKGT